MLLPVVGLYVDYSRISTARGTQSRSAQCFNSTQRQVISFEAKAWRPCFIYSSLNIDSIFEDGADICVGKFEWFLYLSHSGFLLEVQIGVLLQVTRWSVKVVSEIWRSNVLRRILLFLAKTEISSARELRDKQIKLSSLPFTHFYFCSWKMKDWQDWKEKRSNQSVSLETNIKGKK